ncbi:FGGY-family carbohydrate kinase [Paenibacillus amylolyticus]|nr:FGGY-family carbohydrate kinase [Paenibacillus amylolyticus]
MNGKVRTLKNRSGLWLLQECKRQWERENQLFTHEELIQLATLATPHQSYVSPGDGVYLAPGNMAERIRQQCSLTGQTVPKTTGAIVRCILESLALEFRQTLDELQLITGTRPRVIHMVGGGVQSTIVPVYSQCSRCTGGGRAGRGDFSRKFHAAIPCAWRSE